ncbi:hypothetical protein [Halogranum amylolyticum]|uniref:hypothetical protein n=1 Tax=Halogranum amylolyticum TaxID=660520 RepID=UPI00147F8AE7|nr:hypothetical protein [Halogranum amylolyticum]
MAETTDGGDGPRHSGYVDRIRDLAAEAREARETFDPPERTDPSGDGEAATEADERALRCARDGVGPVVALYVEAHSAAWDVEFSGEELRLLHRALNDWLSLYARCYGVDLDAAFSIREAAELLLKTHDICDTAQLLTCVPPRRG